MNKSSLHQRESKIAGFSCLGIILNILLFIIKLISGLMTGSVAILTDSVNNLTDAGSSGITLIGVKIANAKPDSKHPFGHGRAEYLSGIIISMLIFFMGFEFLRESIQKIITPDPIRTDHFFVVVILLLISVLIKMAMWIYNLHFGTKLKSVAMRATATDSLCDAVATAVVFVSLIVTRFSGFARLDGICGFIISLFILYSGTKAFREALVPVLGKSPEPQFVQSVEQIALSHSPILSIHDLVVHDYGPGRLMISLHAEVPSDCSLSEIHSVLDHVETELNAKLGCEAVIHCDPVETGDEKTKELRLSLEQILTELSPDLAVHDFRLIRSKKSTNLVFHLNVPFEFEMDENELCKHVRFEILKRYPFHFCIIQIDRTNMR